MKVASLTGSVKTMRTIRSQLSTTCRRIPFCKDKGGSETEPIGAHPSDHSLQHWCTCYYPKDRLRSSTSERLHVGITCSSDPKEWGLSKDEPKNVKTTIHAGVDQDNR